MAQPYEGKIFEEDLPELRDVIFGPEVLSNQYRGNIDGIMIKPYELLPRLAAQARVAALKHSVSHRGFAVGSAAYVIDRAGRRAGILYGANFTPFSGAPKRCAEMEVLEKAYRGGYERVEAFAVTGPLQTDEKSGLVSPTLHPCGVCRGLIQRHPLIYPDTMLSTADDTGEAHEVYNMMDFFRLHGENYFDDREDPYADDQKLAEAITTGWGDEQRQTAIFRLLARFGLRK